MTGALHRLLLLALAVSLLSFGTSHAHEFRTSFLVAEAVDDLSYRLSWRLHVKDADGMTGDWGAGAGCLLTPTQRMRSGTVEQRDYTLSCTSTSARIAAPRLDEAAFDVLVKIVGAGGEARFEHLDASRDGLWLDASGSGDHTPGSMLVDGVMHVLGGLDHLVYILLLYLFLRRSRPGLLLGITLFTVAHSLTLALSSIGMLRMPPAQVEAVIALTIAYFASAVARGKVVEAGAGGKGWTVIVIVCGLIHGLGFANSLATIGLSGPDFVWNLVSFNIGIELAQIALVATAESARSAIRAFGRGAAPLPLHRPISVAAGALSVFWYLDRVV